MAETVHLRFSKKAIEREDDSIIWIDTGMSTDEFIESAIRIALAPSDKAVVFDPKKGVE